MRQLAISTLLAISVVAGRAGVARAEDPAPEIGMEEGQLHPDFVLPRVDEEGFLRLSDYRGKKVLLFHFASW